ncbi:hypothetical protein UFOVP328_417 [uncultured Caudovirales phage]|uniref:Uncharacterized protein n=1 Tax=uncultured Caudovirales phage TaxID=2100421 RepID=A0A6J5LUJ5_9CAUD|nr:hypothetical protein UFOVP328_417 [uncultured Caudovirales phage]
MATKYKVSAGILLEPRWHQDPPQICVTAGRERINYNLYDQRWFRFDFETDQAQEYITVEFLNKQNTDTVPEQGLDKAVIVRTVDFFGIQDPKFVWAGVYEPRYPEPWASQQTTLEPVLKNYNYLGWNGKWTLTFDVPVFTWIHQVQNLGWIYR